MRIYVGVMKLWSLFIHGLKYGMIRWWEGLWWELCVYIVCMQLDMCECFRTQYFSQLVTIIKKDKLIWKHVMCNFQDGKTALDIAVEKGHNEIIQILNTSQSKVRCTLKYQQYKIKICMQINWFNILYCLNHIRYIPVNKGEVNSLNLT